MEEQAIINSEINLIRFPIFLLNRPIDKNRSLKLTISPDQLWEVIPDPRYGLPGVIAKRVFRAVEFTIALHDWPIKNPVPLFPIRKMAKLIGLDPDSGRTHNVCLLYTSPSPRD